VLRGVGNDGLERLDGAALDYLQAADPEWRVHEVVAVRVHRDFGVLEHDPEVALLGSLDLRDLNAA
jgi:hypothetical protein